MSEFKSWRSYLDFVVAVRRKGRFIHDEEVSEFLKTLSYTATKRVLEIPAGKALWRAQIGHSWKRCFSKEKEYLASIEHPYSQERMKPTPKFAVEGRANPKGILVLYTSTARTTCLNEVRPWKNAIITVAKLKTNRALRIVNCHRNRAIQRTIWVNSEPTPNKRESMVWDDIDHAFSSPVTNDDTSPDYVPTQIIAELFAKEGFDGIQYKSAFDGGKNIALFDLNSADVTSVNLTKCATVEFGFRDVTSSVIKDLVMLNDQVQVSSESYDYVDDKFIGHHELLRLMFRS